MDALPAVSVKLNNLTYKVQVPVEEESHGGPPKPPCFQKKKEFTVLEGLTAEFPAGSMTLAIAPPGTGGVSSLFRVLSGRVPADQLSGEVTYNDIPAGSPDLHVPRLVGYIGEDDIHLPVLTVRETLEFAFRMLNVDLQHLEASEAEEFVASRVEQVIQELHLTNAADTIVGNELLRGVSGGEKKRVTFAEMYVGAARMLLLDKISVGLDSAVTIDICRYCRLLTKTWRTNIIMSLLAPPPEAYQCFSHLMLLRDGKILYHGRRDGVEDYLNSMGLTVPVDEDIADFLQSFVSSPLETYLKQKTTAFLLAHARRLKTAERQLAAGADAGAIVSQSSGALARQISSSEASTTSSARGNAKGAASTSQDGATAVPMAQAATARGESDESDDMQQSTAWKAAASFSYFSKDDMSFLPSTVKTAAPGSTPGALPIPVLCASGTGDIDEDGPSDELASIAEDAEDAPEDAVIVKQIGFIMAKALTEAAMYGGDAAAAAGLTARSLSRIATPESALCRLRAVYAALASGETSAAAAGTGKIVFFQEDGATPVHGPGSGKGGPEALAAAARAAGASALTAEVVLARAKLIHEQYFHLLERSTENFTTAGLVQHWKSSADLRLNLQTAAHALWEVQNGEEDRVVVPTVTSQLETLPITEATRVLDADLRPNGTVRPWNAAQLKDVETDAPANVVASGGKAAKHIDATPAQSIEIASSTPDVESGTGVSISTATGIKDTPTGMAVMQSTGIADEDSSLGRALTFQQVDVTIGRLKRQTSATHHYRTEYTRRQYGDRYSTSFCEQFQTLVGREVALTLRDRIALRARFIQAIFMAVVVGTTFLQVDETDFQVLLGAIFFSATLIAFVNISSIVNVNYARKVVVKQRDAYMYSPWAQALAATIASIPVSLLESLLFSPILYFLVGFNTSADRFFAFTLIIFSSSLAFAALFRFVGSVIPPLEAAQAAGGPITGIMTVLAGFLVTQDGMPDWLFWLTYLSPFFWIVRSLTILEFLSDDYDFVVTPGGPRFGDVALDTFDIPTEFAWYWYSLIFLLGWWAVFSVLTGFALSSTPALVGGGRTVHLEDEEHSEASDVNDSLTERASTLDLQLRHRVKRFKKQARPAASAEVSTSQMESQATAGVGILEEKVFEAPIDFPKMTLAWRDVDYTVTLPDGSDKQLLHGLHGFAKPYSMVCLMGASGAGKTTLLDVLAQRKNQGVVAGNIFVNGVDVKEVNLPLVAGYCEQMDNHMPYATVRECIAMAARLRLPSSVTDEQVEAFTENILDVLELRDSAEHLVGEIGEGESLPAGERKRLTIAVELAANPSILYLDEPTSGLDSRSAALVVKVLRRLANQGRSIICTVHQPSASLFYSFDALLLLKRGGQQIYFGPLGYHATTFTAYMNKVPGAPPLAPRTNVADWMLRVLQQKSTKAGRELLRAAEASGDTKTSSLKQNIGASKDRMLSDEGVVAAQWYRNSQLWTATDAECGRLTTSDEAGSAELASPPRKADKDAQYMASYGKQLQLVLQRQALNAWRNPNYAWVRLRILFTLGLVFGLIFMDVNVDTQSDANSMIGVVFIGCLFVGITSMMSSFVTLFLERPAIYRETAVRMYHPAAYSLAQIVMEIPIILVGTNLFLILLMVAFVNFPNESVGDYFFIMLVVVEVSMFFVMAGQMLSALTPTAQVAQIIAGGTTSLFFLFSGFLAPRDEVPPWFIWIYWINPVQYAVEALITTATTCHDEATCPRITIQSAAGTSETTLGQFVEDFYDFKYSDRTADVFIVLGFIALVLCVKMYAQTRVRFETR